MEIEFDHITSPGEAMEEWRTNYGMDNTEKAWVLHDHDVWMANPYYSGPPVPHPEFAHEDGCMVPHNPPLVFLGPVKPKVVEVDDYDIPF